MKAYWAIALGLTENMHLVLKAFLSMVRYDVLGHQENKYVDQFNKKMKLPIRQMQIIVYKHPSAESICRGFV